MCADPGPIVFVFNAFLSVIGSDIETGKSVTALPRVDENKTGSGLAEMGQGFVIQH